MDVKLSFLAKIGGTSYLTVLKTYNSSGKSEFWKKNSNLLYFSLFIPCRNQRKFKEQLYTIFQTVLHEYGQIAFREWITKEI